MKSVGYLGEKVEEAEDVVGGESSLRRVPEHDVREAGSNVVKKIPHLRVRRQESDAYLISLELKKHVQGDYGGLTIGWEDH